MHSSFRLSTALVTSLSLVAGHMPLAAFAQTAEAECQMGESAEACLARALEAAAAEGAASGEAAAAAEAARLAEEAAAAEAAAAGAAQAAADAAAAQAAQEAADQAAAAAAQAAAEAEANAAAQAAADAEAAAAAQAAADQQAAAAAQAAADQAAVDEAARLAAEAAAADAAAQAQLGADQAAADAAAAEQAAADAAAAEQAAADQAAAQAAAEAEAAAAAQAAEAVTTPAVETAPVAETAPAVTTETPAQTSPATDEAALAAALAAASGEAAATTLGEAAPEQTAEEAAALTEAARLAAEAEQEAAVDPIAEAEAEVEVQAAEAAEQLQSIALIGDAQPVGEIVTETITEEASRSAEEEFGAIVSTEPATTVGDGTPVTVQPSGRNGLTTLETALLAGAAGLVVGSILSGNRQVVNRAEDRVVVLRPQGDYQVIRDDDVLLRRPGNGVSTENFSDGSSRSIVTQPDGAQIVTIRDRDLRILRRTYFAPNGTATVLIDDTAPVQPVIVSQLPQARPVAAAAPITNTATSDALRLALEGQQGYSRNFSLAQIRSIRAVRDLAPAVDLESVTFASGSAAIGPEQARALLALGTYMSDAIARNPSEIFLVEGHTDAVGGAAYNLALSDRRAESVALSLSQYFGVPAQNLVIQGYGEEFLRVPTLADERANRRVAVRRITALLQVASN